MLRCIGLRPLIFTFFIPQLTDRHVTVCTELREVHRFVAALGKIFKRSVGFIPAVNIQSPNINACKRLDQLRVGNLTVRGGNGVVWIRCMDSIRSALQCFVPHIQRSAKPLGMEVVLISEFPEQDGRVGFE